MPHGGSDTARSGFDDYVAIRTADAATLDRLASALEDRARLPAQQALLAAWLDDVDIPTGGRVLEVGCGTGAVLRVLADRPGVRWAVGLDPSHGFLQRARALTPASARVAFVEADAARLPFRSGAFDVVAFYTTLGHVADPRAALAEACRSLRGGGQLAAFEPHRAGITLSRDADDQLEWCVRAGTTAISPWVADGFEALVGEAGFEIVAFRRHAYYEADSPGYMLSIVDRGADRLAASGRIGGERAQALKEEARRRLAAGRFSGRIPYVSVIGRRP